MRRISPIFYVFFALFLLAASTASVAQIAVGISVGFAPPAIPVYEQPVCPVEGYIWTPGFWAWDPDAGDYYWVPGTWIEPPEVGFLWTPGWWGWENAAFFWHPGYWGPHVGWYGGINYGFGYFGHGYEGGRWDHDHFYYNRAVTNVNITEFHNVYNTSIAYRNESRVSYNGGAGGISERPTAQEEAFARERHIAPVAIQQQHIQEAHGNRQLRASVNQGRPPIAATQRAAAFGGAGVVAAREAGGGYEPRNAGRPVGEAANPNQPPITHAKEIAPYQKPAPPNTGNPKLDQKYQQQQQKLYARQNQQVQKLQQQQERDHQRLAQQNASEAQRQRMEQRHQQQTQQLQQRHQQQQQQMQQKQQQSAGKRGR